MSYQNLVRWVCRTPAIRFMRGNLSQIQICLKSIRFNITDYYCNRCVRRRDRVCKKHVIILTSTSLIYILLQFFCLNLLRFQTSFHPYVTDNTAVTVYPIDGNLYAMTETPKIHRLDLENLQSTEMVRLNKNLRFMVILCPDQMLMLFFTGW